MKVEIINKPMLCWDSDESQAEEWHVLAKVTECGSNYPFKVITNENTPEGWGGGCGGEFIFAKPLPQIIEMTVS